MPFPSGGRASGQLLRKHGSGFSSKDHILDKLITGVHSPFEHLLVWLAVELPVLDDAWRLSVDYAAAGHFIGFQSRFRLHQRGMYLTIRFPQSKHS